MSPSLLKKQIHMISTTLVFKEFNVWIKNCPLISVLAIEEEYKKSKVPSTLQTEHQLSRKNIESNKNGSKTFSDDLTGNQITDTATTQFTR